MQVIDGDKLADAAEIAELRSKGHSSLLMVPILSGGRTVGLLEAFTHGGSPWSRLGLARARLFAYQLGMLLEALEPGTSDDADFKRSDRPRGLLPVARLGSWMLQ